VYIKSRNCRPLVMRHATLINYAARGCRLVTQSFPMTGPSRAIKTGTNGPLHRVGTKKKGRPPLAVQVSGNALVEPGMSARSHARRDTVDSPSPVRGRAEVAARARAVANPKSNDIPLSAHGVSFRQSCFDRVTTRGSKNATALTLRDLMLQARAAISRYVSLSLSHSESSKFAFIVAI